MPCDKNRQTLVRLSVAVALCLPAVEPAMAQVGLQCSQKLAVGRFVNCGNGGYLTIGPTGAQKTGSGCFTFIDAPQQALCKAMTFATTGTLKISMSGTKLSMTGAGKITMDFFNIGTAAGGRTKTYTSGSLTASPLTFGIGGRMKIDNGEAAGSYSGKMTVTVTFTN